MAYSPPNCGHVGVSSMPYSARLSSVKSRKTRAGVGDEVAVVRIPYPRAVVCTGGDDKASVRAVRRTDHRIHMPEYAYLCAAGGIPDACCVVPAAADFAPRVDDLHRALDAAVCAAYGWEAAVLQDEEEMLRRLLALNLSLGNP
ncbi:MAG: hypothetical protein SF123_10235 [Chloroflexota bacterium]|nr:hypothetical protein [Chloroflexota bacterium]